MKTLLTYRKRRDRCLKKFSATTILNELTRTAQQSGTIPLFQRGRPCEIEKEKIVTYVLFQRLRHKGYEEMEQESELYLGRHYDHSDFQYHYTNLPTETVTSLTKIFRDKINQLINQTLFHILDSTGLSTSVRVPRTRQGLRHKEKLTDKIHTLLGYNTAFQLIVVENILVTDHHTSDSKGGAKMLLELDLKGYSLGDSKYETYELIEITEEKGLIPIYNPTKQKVRKKLSAKARRRRVWHGNPKRLYKEIRGVGEVLYGAATRSGLIHTHSRLLNNRQKDALLIGLRQNFYTYLRLKVIVYGFIRKSPFEPGMCGICGMD